MFLIMLFLLWNIIGMIINLLIANYLLKDASLIDKYNLTSKKYYILTIILTPLFLLDKNFRNWRIDE
jgi:hypothetical protein